MGEAPDRHIVDVVGTERVSVPALVSAACDSHVDVRVGDRVLRASARV